MKLFVSVCLFKKATGILVQYAANKCLVGNTSRATLCLMAMRSFAVGMDLMDTNARNFYFIALPEKVLVDKLQSAHGVSIKSLKDMQLYVEEDLRIEISDLRQMQLQRIAEYAGLYRSRKALFLRDLIHQLRQNSRRVNNA